jgi:hypothetical protein
VNESAAIERDSIRMASNPSVKKRHRELMLQERQREKAAKRAEREKAEGVRGPVAEGEDPDLAGIVPGPQPIPADS